MTAAAAVETRTSHRATRVRVAPAPAPRSLLRQVRDSLLLMAELAYNNSVTMGNGMSPFYANYSFHQVSSDPATSGPLNPASKLHAHWMHAVHKAFAEWLEPVHK